MLTDGNPPDDSWSPADAMNLADAKGQEHAKRALEVAAAGFHNLLFNGPPGSGKTMLARCLPSILPRMTSEEALEVTKIYSVSGALPADSPLILQRPFRFPHYTISNAGLICGGRCSLMRGDRLDSCLLADNLSTSRPCPWTNPLCPT